MSKKNMEFEWAKPREWLPAERFFLRCGEVLMAIGIPLAIIGFLLWAIGIWTLPFPPNK